MRRTILAVAAILLTTAGCGTTTQGHAGPERTVTATNPAANTAAKPLTAAQITQKLKAAGLNVTAITIYTAANDPNHELGRQNGYTSKTAWIDPAAKKQGDDWSGDKGGTEHGGGIEVFPTAAGAADRIQTLKAYKPPLGDGYDYQAGTAVLRLSNYLTPTQAAVYKKAFDQAMG